MPQLDAATYLSQVSWLTLFFVTYYRIGMKLILPSLASRLKARSKKVALGKGRVSGYDGERLNALSGYDTVVGTSSAWINVKITTAQVNADNWRVEQGRVADASSLEEGNKAYLNAMSTSLAQRILVKAE